jgi:hypothetical protein
MAHPAPQPAASRVLTPMPTPGSPNAPYFKGERVNDFLDSLEVHADAADVAHNDLPAYVLRYCHRQVRYVIDSAAHWNQHDWAATRAYLVKLYGSNDRKPHISPDKLRRWVKRHAGRKAFTRVQHADRYYRDFTAQASRLISSNQLSEKDADILFFRGIPKPQQKTIRRRLPADKTKVQSPPPRDDVLVLLQKEFDEDDIANDRYNTDSSADSSSDTDSYDSDDSSDSDDSPSSKPSRKSKKKVKFSTKKVTTAPIADTSTPSSIEILTKQVKELQLGQTRQIQELQQGQANILRELAAGRMTGGNTAMPERRCFVCDKSNVHRLGIYNCPEVRVLIEEGLVAYSPDG